MHKTKLKSFSLLSPLELLKPAQPKLTWFDSPTRYTGSDLHFGYRSLTASLVILSLLVQILSGSFKIAAITPVANAASPTTPVEVKQSPQAYAQPDSTTYRAGAASDSAMNLSSFKPLMLPVSLVEALAVTTTKASKNTELKISPTTAIQIGSNAKLKDKSNNVQPHLTLDNIYYVNLIIDDSGTAGATCSNIGNTGCSLRSAINQASADGHLNYDLLILKNTTYTLASSALPPLPNNVVMSNSASPTNCTPYIPGSFPTLDLGNIVNGGLILNNNDYIYNLAVQRSTSDGIIITGSNNQLSCVAAIQNAANGVFISAGLSNSSATNNLIGGLHDNLNSPFLPSVPPGPGAFEFIAEENGDYGVYITGTTTTRNKILNSGIGYDPLNYVAATPTGNLTGGICICGGASANSIGNGLPTDLNIISDQVTGGNKDIGIAISSSNGNYVLGNYIGTDETGANTAHTISNQGNGILITGGASNNIIGGAGTGYGNLISSNGAEGIMIVQAGTTNNIVQGNKIGTDITGKLALANTNNGVLIEVGSSSNLIGGTNPGDGNLISGNGQMGIVISNTTTNKVWGNQIGTDINGTSPLANLGGGINLSNNAITNTIGGAAAGQGNLISDNLFAGISIFNGSTSNTIQGNKIGTDISGMSALSNKITAGGGGFGIVIIGSDSNMIGGGSNLGEGNLISANESDGIEISTSNNSSIFGNKIGTDINGTAALGNNADGILITSYPAVTTIVTGNIVGSNVAGQGNLISANKANGIEIAEATNTNVIGNKIGTDISGALDLGNAWNGILLNTGLNGLPTSNNSIIANLISGNSLSASITTTVYAGIKISDANSYNNQVFGNKIGTDIAGMAALPNLANGVILTLGAHNNQVGGASPSQPNTIAYNGTDGVVIGLTPTENTTISNTISANSIFANASLGIDLGYDGVTLNTLGGPHSGPNNFQNFPVLNALVFSGGNLTISGTLNSTPSNIFRIEFFANTTCAPTGYGQGQTYLGAATANTDTSGNATFNASFPAVTGQPVIVATASNTSTGDTSEFSVCFPGNTATTLISKQSTIIYGQSATLTATASILAPWAGTLTGNVTFKDNTTNTILGIVPLNAGLASLVVPTLVAGSHNLVATYSGDNNFSPSTGYNLQFVSKANTTMLFSFTPNPAIPGQNLTFTATVSVLTPGSGVPTGSVISTWSS
jgi:hypothetical protein